MYCSQCGKKVMDTMLFCPFCGNPIMIPDQGDADDRVQVSDFEPLDFSKEADVAQDAEETPAQDQADVDAAPGDKLPDDAADGQDAAAELLDWSQNRREYVSDIWAREYETTSEPFTPLKLDGDDEAKDGDDWREEIGRRKAAGAPEKHPPQMSGSGAEPVRLDGVAPKLENGSGVKRLSPQAMAMEGGARKQANTLVPPKSMDPNDIFMDNRRAGYDDMDEFDRYEPYDAGDKYGAPEFDQDDVSYVEAGEGSFFMRYLRGIVSLAMLLMLLLMIVIYAFSNAGQITLAKLNLAWSPAAYVTLGDQSYEAGQYLQSGQYYERALQREEDYRYASAAAMAYIGAHDDEKAAEMLKRCAQIDPTQIDPYLYLLNMYPDAAQRPWDVTQLLQQGYKATGDSRLKVTG